MTERWKRSTVEKMTAEVSNPDPEAMQRFMDAHGGMTPLQYALHSFPSVRDRVEAAAPHLRPTPEQLSGPAIPTKRRPPRRRK